MTARTIFHADDSIGHLVESGTLTERSADILRAYTRYLRQLRVDYTPDQMAQALADHPQAARVLADMFEAGFDPQREGDAEARRQERRELRETLDESLDGAGEGDVEILRLLAEAVLATVRTNAYQEGKESIALKLLPREISAAPRPRPMFEIWVCAPTVEGVHLRFGTVARGGLRWSDRPDDFRTEILGLVKAQVAKNAVIIPTGSKGGFVPQDLPDRDEDQEGYQKAGEEAYALFIQSLLDVTDNLVTTEDGEEKVVTPEGVVALDDPDHYLVVAADKGTASFSDLANSISQENGFWLGDAFASGGSVGFDHKDMGITARGTWESVKRHFASLGVDCQAEDFTAVGMGGMAGDVFGNGVLLSEHLRLIAAFDTRHIFLDPNPDAAASFRERQRLFDLPRPYWTDYDRSLISEGGGVFRRSDESIPVSAEAREVLGLPDDVERLSPEELITAILKAPVDLMYTGGAGTYVKSTEESNDDAGDASNDAVRIDAPELRVRVVGEGGNLGLTQRARIEAAKNGVLVNTDAIDNSAGVETSDREVNLKILVDRQAKAGELGEDERAGIIEDQVDEVGRRVLRTNRDHNVLLHAERLGVGETLAVADRFADFLESEAGLDREVEFLPSNAEIARRRDAGEALTGPELSVFSAYSKIQLTNALLDSGFGDDPWLVAILEDYFPITVTERFGEEFEGHPLRREIVCTRVANEIVDAAGITFAFRVHEHTGVSFAEVAAAFLTARELFDLRTLLDEHRELPADVDPEAWRVVVHDLQEFIERAVLWVLDRGVAGDGSGVDGGIERALDTVRPDVERAEGLPDGVASDRSEDEAKKREERAAEWGLPEQLGRRWARL